MGDVLRQHCLSEAVRTDEDDIVAAGEEVEREDALEGRAGPSAVGHCQSPVGERLEASESGALEAALDAAALFFFEFGGDDVLEQYGMAPALAGGQGDEVIELVGGVVEPERRRSVCSFVVVVVSSEGIVGLQVMGADVEVTQSGPVGQGESERGLESALPASGFEDVGDGAGAPRASAFEGNVDGGGQFLGSVVV